MRVADDQAAVGAAFAKEGSECRMTPELGQVEDGGVEREGGSERFGRREILGFVDTESIQSKRDGECTSEIGVAVHQEKSHRVVPHR